MADEAQTTPEVKPWEESYTAKPEQAPDPSVMQRFTGAIQQAAEGLKQGKMPWEMDFKAKPVVGPSKPSQGHLSDTFDRVMERLFVQESGNRHRDRAGNLITSPAGAQGVAQVMPKTGKNPGYGVAPLRDDSEAEGRRFGRDYLQAMLKEFDNDYEKALAAYNAGAGSVKRAVAKGGADWMNYLPKGGETIPYVRNIMKGVRSAR